MAMVFRRSIAASCAVIAAASVTSFISVIPAAADPVPGVGSVADLIPSGSAPSNPLFDAIGDRALDAAAQSAIPAGQRAHLASLADAPAQCITANSVKNAASPMFGNCFDWHSDVHAHWALYAASGHTGDARWAVASENDLRLSRISAERSYLSGGAIAGNRYENPYGLGWMLRLARDREAVTGDAALRPLGDAAVGHMKRAMNGWTADAWRRNAGTSEYYNPSWALLNMWEWSQFTGDADLAAWVRGKSDAHLKDPALDQTLPASVDAVSERRGGFFPPALLRLAAVGAIDGAASREWVASRVPADFHVPAYPNIGAAHSNALTFSRAMALNLIGAHLGRADLRANASELIDWQMARPQVWQWGNDYLNTHWIAQFGILAITAAAGPGARVPIPAGPTDPIDPVDPGPPVVPGPPSSSS